MIAEQTPDRTIVFSNVSKFYGEVLGVNKINLTLNPGITSLVGPNGSGKTTLMNLMTGLIQPTRGHVSMLGTTLQEPEKLFQMLGYCTQYDSFPKGLTGYHFIYSFLRLFGYPHKLSEELTWKAIEQVGLTEAAERKVAAYSKGMRQRIKLAQSICHDPLALILDEPLNGLDPMARAEMIDLFQSVAAGGRHLIISSHILHEVDVISDQVVLLDNGYIVAEGNIRAVRSEVKEHPMQILIRCDRPSALAARLLDRNHVVEVKIHQDQQGLLIRTRDADSFYLLLNQVVLENNFKIETVAPADEDVQSVYDYLIGTDGAQS